MITKITNNEELLKLLPALASELQSGKIIEINLVDAAPTEEPVECDCNICRLVNKINDATSNDQDLIREQLLNPFIPLPAEYLELIREFEKENPNLDSGEDDDEEVPESAAVSELLSLDLSKVKASIAVANLGLAIDTDIPEGEFFIAKNPGMDLPSLLSFLSPDYLLVINDTKDNISKVADKLTDQETASKILTKYKNITY